MFNVQKLGWKKNTTHYIFFFLECHWWVLIGPSNIPLDLAICCKAKSNLSFCEIDFGQFQLLVGLVFFPSTPLKNMNVKKRLVEPQIIGVKTTTQLHQPTASVGSQPPHRIPAWAPQTTPPRVTLHRRRGLGFATFRQLTVPWGRGWEITRKMAVLQMKYTAWKKKGMPYKWWVLVVDRILLISIEIYVQCILNGGRKDKDHHNQLKRK